MNAFESALGRLKPARHDGSTSRSVPDISPVFHEDISLNPLHGPRQASQFKTPCSAAWRIRGSSLRSPRSTVFSMMRACGYLGWGTIETSWAIALRAFA